MIKITNLRGLGEYFAEIIKKDPEKAISLILPALKPKVEAEVVVKEKITKEEIINKYFATEENLRKINKVVMSGDNEKTEKLVLEEIKKGVDPLDIIQKGLFPGLVTVAKLYDEEFLFVPDLIIARNAMNAGLSHCKGSLDKVEKKGTILMHVAYGDLHDIGKNMVRVILEAEGYKTIDLGSDVPPEKVIEAIKENNPDVISGTALMTSTRMAFPEIVKLMKENGIVKPFIIAGAAVVESFAEQMDYTIYAKGAEDGAKIMEMTLQDMAWQDIRNKMHHPMLRG